MALVGVAQAGFGVILAHRISFLEIHAGVLVHVGRAGWRIRERKRKAIPVPQVQTAKPLKFFKQKPD